MTLVLDGGALSRKLNRPAPAPVAELGTDTPARPRRVEGFVTGVCTTHAFGHPNQQEQGCDDAMVQTTDMQCID